jgi:hypothetical protein
MERGYVEDDFLVKKNERKRKERKNLELSKIVLFILDSVNS